MQYHIAINDTLKKKFHVSTAGSTRSTPDWGIKIPHAAKHGQKKLRRMPTTYTFGVKCKRDNKCQDPHCLSGHP